MREINSLTKVLVMGAGVEGASVLRYLERLGIPHNQTGLYDRNPAAKVDGDGYALYLGGSLSPTVAAEYDVLIKSPGIPLASVPAEAAAKLTSATELFFRSCPGKIIGVTGTKGKSTTSSLIYAILQEAGIPSALLGNIGTPSLDLLPSLTASHYVVFELSSHQLSTLEVSPHIAVVLGIFPEHLDYYPTMEAYVAAKARIARFQTAGDFIVYREDNDYSKSIAGQSRAEKIPVRMPDSAEPQIESGLSGDMNQFNIRVAMAVGEILGISREIMLSAIRQFSPLPHRLENVGTCRGITFYNDSLSTIPQATIAAVDALGSRVSTLILGGHDRSISYRELAIYLLKSSVRNLIFFPPVGEKIWQEIISLDAKASSRFHTVFVDGMEKAVKSAYELTEPGDICLLSPGASSFTNFKNYKDRGDQFRRYAEELGR